MNPKQAVPLIATVARLAPAIAPLIPALLFGGAIFFTVKWLLSNDDKEKQPETVPVDTANQRTTPGTTVFHPIPAEIPAKPAPVPLRSAPRAVVPPPAIQSVPKVSVPTPASAVVPTIKSVAQVPPPPVKKKFVTREDLAIVFQRGARSLTRIATVAELKRLGFGKSAAYAALTPDGRFTSCLKFASDGIITWKV
jgi:hypothetical protein